MNREEFLLKKQANRKKMEWLGWKAPSRCVTFSAWAEWKALEGEYTFNRLLGFEWRTAK